MKNLLFIRHAESTNNALDARIEAESAGDTALARARWEERREADCGLSPRGLEQCALLGDAVARRELSNVVLVSSPMRRALQTAEAVDAALPDGRGAFLCHGNLFEVGGAYAGDRAVATTTPDVLEARYRVTCRDMAPGGWYSGYHGRESDDEASRRVDGVVAWLERFLRGGNPDFDTAIIVSHGDLMSRWLRRWLGVPIGRGLAFMHHNTGITSLSWDPARGVLLHGINDTSHLPPTMRTGESEGWWNCVLPDLQVTAFERVDDIPPSIQSEVDALRERHLWSVDSRADDYTATNARSVHIVGRSGGRAVSGALYDPATNRLRQMVVDPMYRRHGVGRRTVGGVAAAARRRGESRLDVHAWEASVPFYTRTGFVAVGDVREDNGMPWVPMSMMLQPPDHRSLEQSDPSTA